MTGRALVIGASGGIGRALVEALEARGQDVTALSRQQDGLDVTDQTSVDRILGALEGPFATILMTCGILAPSGGGPEKALSHIDANVMREVMAVNAIGPALILRHVPRLLPRTERAVVGVLTARVGSIGDNRLGGWYAYRASKAAALNLGRNLANDLSPEGIAVGIYHPGWVQTDMGGNAANVTPEDSARGLVARFDALSLETTGVFEGYDGVAIPF